MTDTHKTAYLWGPISTFTAPLAAWLVAKGWHIHIATKSSLNLFTLSSLDLASAAKDSLEDVFGARNKFKAFQDRLKFLDANEIPRDTKYDALIFCGLPPNFDDARVPRAPWAAAELPAVAKALKGVPVFLISSLWGGVQPDMVVPEELEFERRKACSYWERICQNYELKLIEGLSKVEANWYFVRLPLITGATANGYSFAFNGLANLFAALDPESPARHSKTNNISPPITVNQSVPLAHQPDATLWFLPIDIMVYMFWRYLEDDLRPRICNFVSTQATLNREWLQYLARALQLKEIVSTNQKDHLNLPLVLRKLLQDNVQVKTRNLFEVAGRYQLRAEKLDQEYFAKIVQAGRQKNWGNHQVVVPVQAAFTPDIANYYFEEFVPSNLDGELLKKITQGNTSVGFKFKDNDGIGWILKSIQTNGDNTYVEKAYIQRYKDNSDKPRVCYHLTSRIMLELAQGKLPLHKGLILKQIEVEGPILDTIRVSQALSRFMSNHPLKDYPRS